MLLDGAVVTALDLRLEIAGSIQAAVLSSATLDKSFTHLPLSPSSVIRCQCKLGSKQAHCASHGPHFCCLAASVGAWLRASESKISAPLWANIAWEKPT